MSLSTSQPRPFAFAVERLRAVGLRPTKQRMALCRRLFEAGDRHVTAETLHGEVLESGLKVSLATVYNTLHQFTKAGLLREVVVDGAKTYFDTNVSAHHHFYDMDAGALSDIPGDGIAICGLPGAPEGLEVQSIDITIRVRRTRT
jgi:Fur family iron response transcriptional regulator